MFRAALLIVCLLALGSVPAVSQRAESANHTAQILLPKGFWRGSANGKPWWMAGGREAMPPLLSVASPIVAAVASSEWGLLGPAAVVASAMSLAPAVAGMAVGGLSSSAVMSIGNTVPAPAPA